MMMLDDKSEDQHSDYTLHPEDGMNVCGRCYGYLLYLVVVEKFYLKPQM